MFGQSGSYCKYKKYYQGIVIFINKEIIEYIKIYIIIKFIIYIYC